MKKLVLFASIIGCFVSNVNAQINVDPNSGNVAIKTTETPLSSLSIGDGGASDFSLYTTGAQNGMFCKTTGNNYNWGFAGDFENYGTNSNFIVGLKGSVFSTTYTDRDSGRSFGLIGVGGYATSGWNYGVFGRIMGAHNGASIYGTTDTSENGTYIDGRYAGYFNGNTKVVGNITVTGSINGLVLGQSANAITETRSLNSDAGNISDKLSKLNAISYYKIEPKAAKAIINYGDTAVTSSKPTLIESQDLAKQHFALSAESLEEIYPDLVYTNDDGSKSINYVEMIPLLVQSINELKAEIKELKSNTNGTTNIDSTSNYSEPSLSQNSPNPFTTSSQIKLYVPDNIKNATICIYDLSGKQIEKINIANRGEIQISLSSSNLNDGMYLYSLITDGKIIATKRMIITK